MKFYIEAIGFGRGLGVLDINKESISKCNMLNPDLLSTEDRVDIKNAFNTIIKKEIDDVELEFTDDDWIHFNKTVLKAFGIENYYDKILKSLLSLRKVRKTAKQR